MQWVRAVAVVLGASCCFPFGAVAAEVVVVESKDQTSKDLKLKFELEKTTWDDETLNIWGTVENTGKVKYKYVQVIFTCKDKNKKFLGRNTWFVEPEDIGKGEVGYIEEKFVETEGRKPAILEWKVIGEE